ncbi:MAG: hypothetical protein J6575_05920 [Bifidobacterium sp.]|nr:hypothetical protein [Bifidobacterium sp.]
MVRRGVVFRVVAAVAALALAFALPAGSAMVGELPSVASVPASSAQHRDS